VSGRKLRGKDRGKIKLDAASVPHDKCREDYAATYVTRQKDRGTKLREKKLKILRGKKKKGVEKPQAVKCYTTIKKTHGENYSAVQKGRTEIESKDGPYRAWRKEIWRGKIKTLCGKTNLQK